MLVHQNETIIIKGFLVPPPPKLCFLPTRIDSDDKEYHKTENEYSKVNTNLDAITTEMGKREFLHHNCFTTVFPTWKKAIERVNFSAWSGLMTASIIEYLLKSTTTIGGN